MIRSRLGLLASRALDSIPVSAALRLLEWADEGAHDLLAVLTYHRVAHADAVRGFPGLVSASPCEFDEQMAFLAQHYRVVALDDVLEAHDGGRPVGRKAVLLTFDDAYRDFAEYAWPVLRRRKLPVTLFVPTAYPGQPDRSFWWDWLYEAIANAPTPTVLSTPDGPVPLTTRHSRATAYRRLRGEVFRQSHTAAMEFVTEIAADQLGLPPPAAQVLDWPELQELAADGVTLAPHTRTHPLLERLDAAELETELGGSYADLERHIGTAPPALAYPSGSYSTAVRNAVEEAGFNLGFTTRRGLNRLGHTDWLTLRRINVGQASSRNVLRAQLGRWTLGGTRGGHATSGSQPRGLPGEGMVNADWQPSPPTLSPFESFARLFASAATDVDTQVVQAGTSWTLKPLRGLRGDRVVWGNIPTYGGSIWSVLGWTLRREAALRQVHRRHRQAIRGVHRLPPASLMSPVPPWLRSILLGGLLVEFGDEHSLPRVIDLVAGNAFAASGEPLRLRPSRDGSALARVASEDGTPLELRVATVGGRTDPSRNAGALMALERHGTAHTPRLQGHGVIAGASWTTETWLPGRQPQTLSRPVVRDVSSFCASLPRQEEPTSLRERMTDLAGRYPRWASLTRQLARREIRSPGILQHGDLWLGNLLARRGHLTGVVDWDTWHPAGVPGVDLLQLVAMDRRSRTGEDIGALWQSGIWRSAEFVSGAEPYWRAIGITVNDDFLEALGLDWWSGQLFKRQTRTSRPGWIEDNVDRVLEAMNGTR